MVSFEHIAMENPDSNQYVRGGRGENGHYLQQDAQILGSYCRIDP
jgi:hypothetical protein